MRRLNRRPGTRRRGCDRTARFPRERRRGRPVVPRVDVRRQQGHQHGRGAGSRASSRRARRLRVPSARGMARPRARCREKAVVGATRLPDTAGGVEASSRARFHALGGRATPRVCARHVVITGWVPRPPTPRPRPCARRDCGASDAESDAKIVFGAPETPRGTATLRDTYGREKGRSETQDVMRHTAFGASPKQIERAPGVVICISCESHQIIKRGTHTRGTCDTDRENTTSTRRRASRSRTFLDVAVSLVKDNLPDPADLAMRGEPRMRDAVDATGRKVEEIGERDASGRGYLSTLKCLRRRGRLRDERRLCAAAARRSGLLEELKSFRAENLPWDGLTCARAAEGGHRDSQVGAR